MNEDTSHIVEKLTRLCEHSVKTYCCSSGLNTSYSTLFKQKICQNTINQIELCIDLLMDFHSDCDRLSAFADSFIKYKEGVENEAR